MAILEFHLLYDYQNVAIRLFMNFSLTMTSDV